MATKGSSSYEATAFPVTVFAHLVTVAVVTLVLVWLLHFREGLAFKSDIKNKIFNVHPLLMALGFVLIQGQAVMAYKTIPVTRKKRKVVHMVLHLIALLAAIIGIYAVFKFHEEINVSHMYSLHSWFGMSTICLFGLQWIFSFFAFFYPGARPSARSRLTTWHPVIGLAIFFMAIITAETGLVEKFFFLGLHRNQEALVMNFTGLLIFLYAVAVGITVLLPRTRN